MKEDYKLNLVRLVLEGNLREQFYAKSILRQNEKNTKPIDPPTNKRLGQLLPTNNMEYDYRTRGQRMGRDYRTTVLWACVGLTLAVFLTSLTLEIYV